MSKLRLEPTEEVLAVLDARGTWVGPAAGYRWWYMTVGGLTLTDRRLIFEPNQLYSFGLGRRWEAPLDGLEGVTWLRPLEGEPPALGLNRLVFYRGDGSEALFALFILNDLPGFLDSLQKTMIRLRSAAGQDTAPWENPRDDDTEGYYAKQFIMHRQWFVVLMVLLTMLLLAALAIIVYERTAA